MKTQQITVDSTTWEEYETLLNYLASERDIMKGDFIESNDIEKITAYLES